MATVVDEANQDILPDGWLKPIRCGWDEIDPPFARRS